jgi:hypothetical protein
MSRIPGAFRTASALAGLLVPSAALHAQLVSARAVVTAPQSSVRFGDGVERASGVWGGLEVGLRAGRLTLLGSGARGRLTPEDGLLARTVGEVTLTGRFDVLSWLGAESRYLVRAATSPVGYQRWELWGVGARVRQQMGGPVRVSAGLVYSPVARVTGIEDPTLALSADVGISLFPGTVPLQLGLTYRTERYTFPSAAGRSEQFEAFTLVAGLDVRRERGRWTLRGGR